MKKLVVILLCFFAFNSFSQSAKEYVKKAERELNKSYPSYDVAIGHLNKAKEIDSTQVDIEFLLALCHMQTTNQENALPHIDFVINSGQEYNDELNFFKAYLLHRKGDFDNAKYHYQSYLDSLTVEERKVKKILTVTYYVITSIRQGHTFDVLPFNNIGKIVENRIKQCEAGSHLIANKKFYEVTNMGSKVNSSYDEYAPVYSKSDNNLYFTSRRPIPNHLKKESSDELFLEHIFKSQKRNGLWSDAHLENPPLNSYTHNVSALTITNDGTDIFIFDYRHHGDIMHSEKAANGKWTTPVVFEEAFSSEGIERSFTINDDKTIAFLERDDEIGHDRDLFYSVRVDGKWSKPKNAGETLNTDVNEDGVYLSPDGKTLYFSSDRYNSMGGYDIFKSEYVSGAWSEPVNMGYPINSTYDDVFFVISKDADFAFFSSDRPGGKGGYDIYYTDLKPMPLTQKILCDVTNDESGYKIPDADVYLLDKSTGVKYPMVYNSATEKYEVEVPNTKGQEDFSIHAAKRTFVSSDRSFKVKDLNNEYYAGSISIKGIPEEIESIVFNDVYLFDVKSSEFFEKYHKRLETLITNMKKYDVEIVIEGHTDNSGDDKMNQELSESRAAAVKEYLVKNGVKAKNISTKGYGETKPLNNNANKKEKSANRRVEVSMVQEIKVTK